MLTKILEDFCHLNYVLGQVLFTFKQKVQIWPEVWSKISKIASPCMKVCTETSTLASGRKAVFSSVTISMNNEDVFEDVSRINHRQWR